MKIPVSLPTSLACLSSLCALSQSVLPAAANHSLPSASKPAHTSVAADYGKLPLSFEANQGQSDPQVKFLARGEGYSLFLTDSAAVLSLTKTDPSSKKPGPGLTAGKPSKLEAAAAKTDVVRMELSGANPGLRVSGADQLEGKSNYFIGNDPSKWHANVPTYAQVKYTGVYPGVDLVYYGNQRQLEYDFVVAAQADSKPVRLHFAGASKLKLNAAGDLRVIAKDGEIAFHKPVVYQTKDGRRQPVQGDFALQADNTVGFRLGAYDHDRELVIDPVLAYSTYLGGTGNDYATGIAVDAEGDAYVAGSTGSTDFPITPGAFQQTGSSGSSSSNNGTAFVTKFNPEGTAQIYSTYMGGAPSAIQIDAAGNAYITGYTYSEGFPVTTGAFQTTAASPTVANAFVTKLNSTGSALVYSTLLGGSIGSVGKAVAVDAEGHAFITGTTRDTDFPVTSNAFQPKIRDSGSGFVAAFNATGSGLIYSTYLGGFGSRTFDTLTGIAVDTLGDAYITGYTSGDGYPVTRGAYLTGNTVNYGTTGFITKLNPTGSGLAYSTLLGEANSSMQPAAIAVDAAGDAYVTGSTLDTLYPVTSGAFEQTNENYPYATGFVTKLNPAGSALVYSTFLGGSKEKAAGSNVGDIPTAIALDGAGNAYISGSTSSTDFPVTPNAYQKVNNADAGEYTNSFVTELDATGSNLVYSTYLGGRPGPTSIYSYDPTSIALDSLGNVYLAGSAGSASFPTTEGAFQPVNHSSKTNNVFVSKFELNPRSKQTIDFPAITPQIALTPVELTATASSGLPVTFTSNTPAICAVKASRATLLTAGYCDVTATQAGDGEYFATITGQSFLVHHRRQVIHFNAIAAQPAGTMLPLTASSDSGLPITYTSTTPAVCTVSGSTASLLTAGTCSLEASQVGDATWFPSGPKTVSFSVE